MALIDADEMTDPISDEFASSRWVMTTFEQFAARCKMRHDFSDQIQVRYQHGDGEHYDTWVSGEEVMHRLRTAAAEQRLKGLRELDRESIAEAAEELPDEAQGRLRRYLQARLGDAVEGMLGDNLIGDNLADAVRGRSTEEEPEATEKRRWQTHLEDERFRAVVLELAWINLRGSFPETPDPEPDDWV